jgi:hypothetical protein
MVLIFRYHSMTQRVVHGIPFVLLLGFTAWFSQYSDWRGDAAKLCGLLSFGWLVLANFLINQAISRWGTHVGPLNFSPNSKPTATERILTVLIIIASIVSGLISTIVLVDNIKRGGLETRLIIGGAAFFLVTAVSYGILTFAVIVLSAFRIRPVRG